MNPVRQLIVILGSFVLMCAAQAQVGPSPARAISRPMPSKAPSGVQSFTAEAELVVSKKGRVDSAVVVTGTGDAAFDKEWRKSLEDWRYVPAVDADGQPVDSQALVTYKNNVLSDRPSGAAAATASNAITESDRIARLTCKDFLWEYNVVTNALPRRLALLDPLLKTPLTMLASEGADAARVTALRAGYDDLVDEAAKQCRDNPDALFWAGIFKPLLQAAP